MTDHKYTIIVAGGQGTRMQQEVPKQFLNLLGKPILMHTIEAFYNYGPDIPIILVLPETQFTYWADLCKQHDFTLPVIIRKGGKTRFQSVKNGLDAISGEGLVAVHDGVRPLVPIELIAASFHLAAIHGSAIASVRLKESIRILNKDSSMAMDRSKFRLIQTPQTFNISVLKKAYEIDEEEMLTDDASVAEKAGYKISLFEGSYANIKITTQEDLWMAEQILNLQFTQK